MIFVIGGGSNVDVCTSLVSDAVFLTYRYWPTFSLSYRNRFSLPDSDHVRQTAEQSETDICGDILRVTPTAGCPPVVGKVVV